MIQFLPPLLAALMTASPLHAAERSAVKGLSRETAGARSARVWGVRYELELSLSSKKREFSGSTVIRFNLDDSGTPLSVDFNDGKIKKLLVNGESLKPDYNGMFITVPAGKLRRGANVLSLRYTHPYSTDGAGLYRFRDPTDNRSYLYTDFEPYDANRLFPCFDQPDIKASYALKVAAPASWTVLSAMPESSIEKAGKGMRRWTFPESRRFSTYLFSLHAGPYMLWKDSFEGMPLRLFARRSIADYVDVEDWFRVSKQGLRFYNGYFDYRYPFEKYDQIIVPDFNSGAMENVAAVTFSERYVQRSSSTWKQREGRAGVILHEMAHMWFGDLVTMRWWNDLWLNESFASYMADLALVRATEYRDAWQSFFLGDKQWAYWEDQLVTTHPIEADIAGTEGAFSNFDGITYGKGGSVLKQISFYIGPDKFRDGVRRYFKRHEFGSARRADFMRALEEASGRKLEVWTREWLQTAGLNSLGAEFACENGRLASLSLRQKAPKNLPTLRTHRTKIGFFYSRGSGPLTTASSLDVLYGPEPASLRVPSGVDCPSLVFPNRGDYDYAKILLDKKSLKTAKARLSDVSDDLDRAMLWMTLWGMVEDARLPVSEYADLVLRHLPKERSFQALAKVSGTIWGSGWDINEDSILKYLGGESPYRKHLRARYLKRFENLAWKQLRAAGPGSDEQKLWLDTFIKVAETPSALKRLARLLDGKIRLPKFSLDQDRRWDIVAQLNRRAAAGSYARIASELRRDRSRRGQTKAIQAEVIRPEWSTKEKWLKNIVARGSRHAFAELRAAMEYIFPYEQADFRRRFADEFYSSLKPLIRRKPNQFLSRYAGRLAPTTCLEPESGRLGAFLKDTPGMPPVVVKALKVARQENDRCLSVRRRVRTKRSNSGR